MMLFGLAALPFAWFTFTNYQKGLRRAPIFFGIVMGLALAAIIAFILGWIIGI